MSKKKNILRILESQIDKIVLGVIVLVSLVLLWMYVIGNPYGEKVRINGPEVSVNPSNIDRKIMSSAEGLLQGLEQSPEAGKYNVYGETYVADYTQKLQDAIPDVPADISIPYPGVGEAAIEEDRLYAVPSIPPLSDVDAAVVRGTAQVPVEDVTPGVPYASIETNLDDIDFVTVSGHFDVQRLYDNFNLSFNAPGLKSSWRDTRLATPVFARIELQRREVLRDGTFSDWSTLPRTKIDAYKKLLEQLPLHKDQMQFGIDVWISQYQSADVQLDILQPDSYVFAYPSVEWMAPEFLHEKNEIEEKQAAQEKREAIEERRKERESERGGDRRTPTRPARVGAARTPGRGEDLEIATARERLATRRTERTVQNVEQDWKKAMLKKGVRLDSMRDPVLVWVHDDTVQQGHTYEYRIRVGIFNPITGKDWFQKDQLAYKDQTVLWSDYSVPTEAVEIPKMLHVFPTDTLKSNYDSKEIEGVKVEVAKYYMGRWHSHEFDVYPGETIGYPVEDIKEDKGLLTDGYTEIDGRMPGLSSGPQEIDYSSGITMVDIIKKISWGTRMKRTSFYDMLYYETDGLRQMGIGKSNWSAELKNAYSDVQDAIEENVQSGDPMMMSERMPREIGREY